MPRSSSSADPNPISHEPISQASGLQHAIQNLKQQYPDSSLVAEFLTYAANEYAVRVLVKVGDRILSTGMAAASDLEQAEDRARMRAIAALGIDEFNHLLPSSTEAIALAHPHPTTKTPTPKSPRPKPLKPIKAPQPSSSSDPSSPVPPLDHSGSSNSQGSENPPENGNPSPVQAPLSFHEYPSSDASDGPPIATPVSGQQLASQSTEPPLPLAHASNGTQTLQATPDSHPEEHSLSLTKGNQVNLVDAIAKTSVEMQRLGWDIHQGREHLLVTYGKRSRGELNDDELLDFLHFLEKQSPAEVTP